MRLRKFKHVLLGAAIGLVILMPVGVYAFVKSGIYNVAAAQRHTKFTQWITHETMINSVSARATGIAPPGWTSADQLLAGYCAYETHCVACHGAAAVARQPWVSGMEPQPPYLLDVTQRFTPSELFWIAKNGIKMTGMPSWGDSMSDRQLWNVVAWLEASEKLRPQLYVEWRAERRCRSIGEPTPSPGPVAIPPH